MVAVLSTPETPPVHFHWSQVEAPDYREYIKNLRDIGCPEITIADIITADVHGQFARRRAESTPAAYWRSGFGIEAAPSEAMRKLDEEELGMLRELLGANATFAAFGENHAPATSHRLSPELLPKQAALTNWAAAFANQYDELFAATRDREMSEPELAHFQQLRKSQADALKTILTPQELEEFELRNSATADELRASLAEVEVTESEFRSLFRLRQEEIQTMADLAGSDESKIQPLKDAYEQALLNLLGPERFAKFQSLMLNEQPPGADSEPVQTSGYESATIYSTGNLAGLAGDR